MLKVGKSEEKGIALSANLKKLKKNMGEDTFAKLLKKIEDISVKRSVGNILKETVEKGETIQTAKEPKKDGADAVRNITKSEIVKSAENNKSAEAKDGRKLEKIVDAFEQKKEQVKKTELNLEQLKIEKPIEKKHETTNMITPKNELGTRKNLKIEEKEDIDKEKVEKKGEKNHDKQPEIEGLNKGSLLIPSILNAIEIKNQKQNSVENKETGKIEKKGEERNKAQIAVLKAENRKEQIRETAEIAEGKKLAAQVNKIDTENIKKEEKVANEVTKRTESREIILGSKSSTETSIRSLNPKIESSKTEKAEMLKIDTGSTKKEEKVINDVIKKPEQKETIAGSKSSTGTNIQLLNPKIESPKTEKAEMPKINTGSTKKEEKVVNDVIKRTETTREISTNKSSVNTDVKSVNMKIESLKTEKAEMPKIDTASTKKEEKQSNEAIKSAPITRMVSSNESSQSPKTEKAEIAKNEIVELKSNFERLKDTNINMDDKKEAIKSTEKKVNMEREQYTVEKIVMGKANTSYEMNSVYAVPGTERAAVDNIKRKNPADENEKVVDLKENKTKESDRKNSGNERVNIETGNTVKTKRDEIAQKEAVYDTKIENTEVEKKHSKEQTKAFTPEPLTIKGVKEDSMIDNIYKVNLDNEVGIGIGETKNNKEEVDKLPDNVIINPNINKEKPEAGIGFDFKVDTKAERKELKISEMKEFAVPDMVSEYRNQETPVPKIQTTTVRTDRFAEYSFVIDQLNNGIKHSFNPEMKEFKIRLRPEELGDVEVKISIENQIMKAEFKVESEKIKEIIESRFNDLKETLKEKGIYSEAINVTVSDNGRYGQKEQEREWFAERNKKTEKKVIENEKISENSNIGLNRYGYITSSGVNIKA